MLQGTLLLFVAAANLGAISIFITSASRYIGCPRGESVNQVIQVFVFVLVGNKLQADMNIFFVSRLSRDSFGIFVNGVTGNFSRKCHGKNLFL